MTNKTPSVPCKHQTRKSPNSSSMHWWSSCEVD